MSEIANVIHDESALYVGSLHFSTRPVCADAVNKNSVAYEHISPESVGNGLFLMSSCRRCGAEPDQ